MSGEVEFGPAMRALTEKQRLYVLAMASDPLGNPTQWARLAGYSDQSGAAKVVGHANSHNPKVAKAIQEVAQQYLTTFGPMLGLGVMMRIARNDAHPKQLAAAEALANRSGFHETTEHRVLVDDARRDPAVLMERVRELAGRLGLDPAKLLGANAPGPKLIEGEAVKDGGGG